MANVSVDKKTIEGDAEKHKFWSDVAAATPEGSYKYSADIFSKKNLAEDDLLKDADFLHAARVSYEARTGKKWDDYAAENKWTPEQSAAKLAKDGIGHATDLSNQVWESGKLALAIDKMPREVQLANLRLIQSLDHKDASWAGAGRTIWSSLTDPVSLGLMGVGLVAAPFTGGISLGGAAAAVAARTGISKVGQTAFAQALTQAVKHNVVTRVADKVGDAVVAKAVEKTVMGAVARGATATGRALTSQTAVNAGKLGAQEGFVFGVVQNKLEQDIELAPGFRKEFSYLDMMNAGATGATLGWGLGRVMGPLSENTIGRAFKKSSSTAVPSATPAATPSTTPAPTAAPSVTTATATPAALATPNTGSVMIPQLAQQAQGRPPVSPAQQALQAAQMQAQAQRQAVFGGAAGTTATPAQQPQANGLAPTGHFVTSPTSGILVPPGVAPAVPAANPNGISVGGVTISGSAIIRSTSLMAADCP
jgi:hypothetical protein